MFRDEWTTAAGDDVTFGEQLPGQLGRKQRWRSNLPQVGREVP